MKATILITKWAARLISVFLFVFAVLSAFSEMPHPRTLTSHEITLFITFGFIFVGFIFAWFKQILGGAIGFVSTILFMTIAQMTNGFMYIILLGGVLFLLSGILEKIHSEEEPKS